MLDPTFDPPGRYEREGAPALVKTRGPAVEADGLGPLGLALVSHDHHPDNLDAAGRELLSTVPLVLTTVAGAQRLGGTAPGALRVDRRRPARRPQPARHRDPRPARPGRHGPPDGLRDRLPPHRRRAAHRPRQRRQRFARRRFRRIADRLGPVDVAVLFAGGACLAGRFDGALLTLGNRETPEAAQILGAGRRARPP